MCKRSSLMRLTITFIVLLSSYVSVFNRLTHRHILSPSVCYLPCVWNKKEFHMGIIIMIRNVLIFNCEKEDRQYRIKWKYFIRFWYIDSNKKEKENLFSIINKLMSCIDTFFSLVNVSSKRSTCMMSSNPLATITFSDQKTSPKDDISSLSMNMKMCRSILRSMNISKTTWNSNWKSKEKWTSNYLRSRD